MFLDISPRYGNCIIGCRCYYREYLHRNHHLCAATAIHEAKARLLEVFFEETIYCQSTPGIASLAQLFCHTSKS